MGAKRYAVSHIAFADCELTTEIVIAFDWKEAALKHEKILEMFTEEPEEAEEGEDEVEGESTIPDDLDEAKQAAFDQDAMINVVEITDPWVR